MSRATFLSIFLAAAVTLAHTGCESTLFIELEEADKLIVLNGAITADTTVSVQVSRTRHILDNAPVVPLENARVSLYRGSTFLEELTYTGNGYYSSLAYIPAIGESYTVTVENAGYPPVSASTMIPPPVTIEGIDTVSVTKEFDDGYGYYYSEQMLQFDMTIQDPPGEDNFYLLFAGVDRSWSEWRDSTVTLWDSSYINGEWRYYRWDSTFMYTIIHREQGYPFIYSEDLVVEATTSVGVLFSDHLFDGKSYSLRGNFQTYDLTSADSAVVELRLHTISESYYKYLKSRQAHFDTKENLLAVPVIVYSNVEEGAGFFGGYSTDIRTFTTFVPEYGYYWYDYY